MTRRYGWSREYRRDDFPALPENSVSKPDTNEPDRVRSAQEAKRTVGQIADQNNLYGIVIDGLKPTAWSRWLNFSDSASAFLKHEKISLNWDGTATFTGVTGGSLLIEAADGTDLANISSTIVQLQNDAETTGITLAGTRPVGWTGYADFTAVAGEVVLGGSVVVPTALRIGTTGNKSTAAVLSLWATNLPADAYFTRLGTAANGQTLGSLYFDHDTASGLGQIDVVADDVTSGSEDFSFVFKAPVAGANLTTLLTLGATIASARAVTITNTAAPQLSTRYDASNRLDLSVSSDGAATYDAVGASAGHTFSDAVTVSGLLTASALANINGTAQSVLTVTSTNVGTFGGLVIKHDKTGGQPLISWQDTSGEFGYIYGVRSSDTLFVQDLGLTVSGLLTANGDFTIRDTAVDATLKLSTRTVMRTVGGTGTILRFNPATSGADIQWNNFADTLNNMVLTDAGALTLRAGLTATTGTFSGLLTASAGVAGNASTATTLQTARAINTINFDGSAAITAGLGVLAQITGAEQILAGATSYFSVGTAGSNGTEPPRKVPLPRAMTVSNLYVTTSSAQPGGGSLVFTVRKNGVDTTLVVTIAAGAAAGTFSDAVNSVSFAAGDVFSLKVVNNDAGAASAQIQGWSFSYLVTA